MIPVTGTRCTTLVIEISKLKLYERGVVVSSPSKTIICYAEKRSTGSRGPLVYGSAKTFMMHTHLAYEKDTCFDSSRRGLIPESLPKAPLLSSHFGTDTPLLY